MAASRRLCTRLKNAFGKTEDLQNASTATITNYKRMTNDVMMDVKRKKHSKKMEGDCNSRYFQSEEQSRAGLISSLETAESKCMPPDPDDTSANAVLMPVGVGRERLRQAFYDVPCEQLAQRLLGKVLVRKLEDGAVLRGRIVETECYLGGEDKASHSFRGKKTPRNTAMFMPPGTAYVYMTYGMYYCFNISSRGDGAAVLLRSLEPLEGLETMEKLRQSHRKMSVKSSLRSHQLCNGPGKLCLAFDVTKTCDKQDLVIWEDMWVEEDEEAIATFSVIHSSRIGITSAGPEWASKLLRFYVLGNKSVSVRDHKRESEFLKSV